jgi:hypothetical protein
MMWRNQCFKFSIITAFLHFMISLYPIDREVVLVLIRDRQSSVLKPSQIQHSWSHWLLSPKSVCLSIRILFQRLVVSCCRKLSGNESCWWILKKIYLCPGKMVLLIVCDDEHGLLTVRDRHSKFILPLRLKLLQIIIYLSSI